MSVSAIRNSSADEISSDGSDFPHIKISYFSQYSPHQALVAWHRNGIVRFTKEISDEDQDYRHRRRARICSDGWCCAGKERSGQLLQHLGESRRLLAGRRQNLQVNW